MRKFYILITAGLLLIILQAACDKFGKQEENIEGMLTVYSDCKQMKSAEDDADTLSCIQYIYNKDAKVLALHHENAAFNCCPNKLSCTISSNMDTILVVELEEEAQCNCNCLYDLDISLTEVQEKRYIIKVVEPYNNDEEELLAEIDLKKNPEGTFCAVRKKYPWGMSLIWEVD